MIPQSKSSVLATYATDGVVVTCNRYASAPDAVSPDTSEYSNM